MEENSKKKIILPVIGLIVVGVLVLLLGTYAYWQVTRKQTSRNLVGSACLDITFSNETGDIDLENQWPTSDSDGSKLVPYTFTLTNTCPDELVNYTVALEEIKDDSDDPITYPNDYLSDANIKIKFDSLAPVKISTLDDITNDTEQDYEIYKTKKLINRKLAGGESRTHSVRLWLDQNAPETEMNKFFLSKIKIIAGQGINEECYAVNSEGLLYAYDPDCGTSATVPATVDGKQLKTIASTAFKGDKQVRQAIYHDEFLEKEENDTVPTKDDFAALRNNRCKNTSNTSVNCTIDYSVAYSRELYEAVNDENYMASIFEEKGWDPEDPASEQLFYQYIAETFSVNDIGFVIYYNGNDTARANFIRNKGVQTLSEILPMFGETTPELINSRIYMSSNPTLENYYEIYSATTYDSHDDRWEVYDNGVGYKEPTDNFASEYGLLATSLDLSQATNLEKIESRAFSTAPDLVNITQWPDFSTYPGLTSLTFGNNTNNIELGGAAFSGANLSNLTIYTNYVTPSLNTEEATALNQELNNPGDKTFMYSVMGPFVGAHIQNLTITGAGGVTEYNGMPGFSISNDPYNSANIWAYLIYAGEFAGFYADNITFTGNITAINNVPNVNTNWNLTLPDSLQTVGDYAFATFKGSSLTLPSSLTTIGYDAFQSYEGSTLTIPASLTRIKKGAFQQFRGTATVNNSSGNVNFDDGWISNSATVNWN